MNEIWDFFSNLLDSSDFPPRWHCGYWSSFHGWLYIISDFAIWGAYFAIPIIIIKFVSKRYDARFIKLYFLFAAFILACGSTHFLDALTFWFPFYRINALVRLVTAIISWITVFSLIRILPMALTLKTADQLENEISQRMKAEEKLRINNFMLTEAQEIARLGHWQWDVVNDNVTWSDMTLKLYGLDAREREMSYEQYLTKIHPEDTNYVDELVRQSFKNKIFTNFYHRVILPDGQQRVLLSRGEVIANSSGNIIKMIGTVQDVTEIKNTEYELSLKTQKLEASNQELQKFASIASHDLREPLRKIITFGSMLEREIVAINNDKTTMLVQKITSSSLRLQKLVDDILNFSKLTVQDEYFNKLRLNDVIAEVLSDMEVSIEKSKAVIEVSQLPEIDGNASQLGQLFQNLISNALKFHGEDVTPVIHINSRNMDGQMLVEQYPQLTPTPFSVVGNPEYLKSERYCMISVTDNGIGFDTVYLDKIFLIFQRLHDRAEYEGTGIGLAVCKKVVDLHNGYITAESTPGKGATFRIILPFSQAHFINE